MAAASIWPDTEFRKEDRSTARWHFIDICYRTGESFADAMPLEELAFTVKIDEYAKRLKEGDCDKWGGDGDLAFLIHFVGDIHQPLHAATDAAGTAIASPWNRAHALEISTRPGIRPVVYRL